MCANLQIHSQLVIKIGNIWAISTCVQIWFWTYLNLSTYLCEIRWKKKKYWQSDMQTSILNKRFEKFTYHFLIHITCRLVFLWCWAVIRSNSWFECIVAFVGHAYLYDYLIRIAHTETQTHAHTHTHIHIFIADTTQTRIGLLNVYMTSMKSLTPPLMLMFSSNCKQLMP